MSDARPAGAPLSHLPGAALPAARTLRLVHVPASQGAPGAIRGAAGYGGSSVGAGSSLGAGCGSSPGRAGSRRAGGREGSLLPKLRVARGDSIAFIAGFAIREAVFGGKERLRAQGRSWLPRDARRGGAAAAPLRSGQGLRAAPGSLVAAVSPLACRSSRNFLGVLSHWRGSFPIVTLCVKEYFVPWHVYSNSSRLFSHSYEFF